MITTPRLHVKSRIPTSYVLTPGNYLIGRHRECNIIIDSPDVSRRHGLLEIPSVGCIMLTDLGSFNRTRVNGIIVNSIALVSDSIIEFGCTVCVLEFSRQQTSDDDNPTPRVHKQDCFTCLTDAQHRIFLALLDGQSEKEIASKYCISHHTVHNHIRRIYKKYNVNSRSELLAIFISRPHFNSQKLKE